MISNALANRLQSMRGANSIDGASNTSRAKKRDQCTAMSTNAINYVRWTCDSPYRISKNNYFPKENILEKLLSIFSSWQGAYDLVEEKKEKIIQKYLCFSHFTGY